MHGGGVILTCATFLVATLAATAALAHDWYDESTTTDGEPCCGGEECAPLADGDVVEVAGGYLIRSLGITVPFAQTQPSPTDASTPASGGFRNRR